ncbi:unnamed protein product [Prunus armeniaca]|uniref:Uncharacterized protein n=1 Tax=Prunus armeniaca TaxID=36596 RepID=A0A6J5VBF2_PRUAR|nr:unnamed protein product [Prunus armeniaca]
MTNKVNMEEIIAHNMKVARSDDPYDLSVLRMHLRTTKDLQEAWPVLKSALEEYGISCALDVDALPSPPPKWINKESTANGGLYNRQQETGFGGAYEQPPVKKVYQVKTRAPQDMSDARDQTGREGTKTSFTSVYVAHGNKRLTLWFDAKVIRLARFAQPVAREPQKDGLLH